METAHTFLCALLLLLPLEETLYYKSGESGHAQTCNGQQGEEENFECKVIFIHAYILARALRYFRHS